MNQKEIDEYIREYEREQLRKHQNMMKKLNLVQKSDIKTCQLMNKSGEKVSKLLMG